MSLTRKKIIIIGAGGFGREVYRYLVELVDENHEIEIEGFWDNNRDALNEFSYIDKGFIENADSSEILKDCFYVCAIGEVDTRERIYNEIKNRGGKFFTFIHSSARVSESCIINEGAIICPGVILTENVRIGENVILNLNVLCGHDSQIGKHSVISPAVNINGNVMIGNKVFIGSSAVVTPGTRIGDNCRVSAGSIVYKSWDANLLLHGNPAKKVKVLGR